VRTALVEFEKSADFDAVFCFIDKDAHISYTEALDKIKTTKLRKKLLPNDRKGIENLYEQLLPKLETAIRHAKQALQEAQRTGCDNPSTEIHNLVAYLHNLHDQRYCF
jgi:hypothetical protein